MDQSEKFVEDYKIINEYRDYDIVRKDVNFCRTAKVPEPEYYALLSGFRKIIQETGRDVRLHDFGNYHVKGTVEYGSPDWYQLRALIKRDRGYGRQANAKTINRLLREEPFQKQNPHFDAMMVDKDLTTYPDESENNFIFGYGPYPNNIISTKRFQRWLKDPKLRKACLAIVGAHEFSHNLGLAHRNFNIGTEGYKRGHCNGESGPCLMEQVNVPNAKTITQLTKEIIHRENWLCPDCADEIQYKKEFSKREGISW